MFMYDGSASYLLDLIAAVEFQGRHLAGYEGYRRRISPPVSITVDRSSDFIPDPAKIVFSSKGRVVKWPMVAIPPARKDRALKVCV